MMTPTLSPKFPRRVLLLALLLGAGACKKSAPAPSTPAASPPVEVKAAKAANEASPAAASAKAPPTAEVDLGKLEEAERAIFHQVVGHEPSACGKGQSLLDSAKRDPACPASRFAVHYVARLADAGLTAAEITDKLEQRFRAPRIPYIDISQAPKKGHPEGRVTVVEFADFTCEHCRQAQAFIPKLLATYPKDVTLYFKHFPLGGSVGGLNAALGAVGAQMQDKFWAFSDKVWENSDRLSAAVLEGIAREIGLDFNRWYTALGTEEVRQRVLRDRAEARTLEIQRTPAFFINGRRFTDEVDLPSLMDWIDEELAR